MVITGLLHICMKISFVALLLLAKILIYAQEQKPQYFNQCGGSLELEPGATYGILTTPNYPSETNRNGKYPNNADCLWTLEGDETTLMQIKLWDLQVEPGENGSNITCEFDYLNITIVSMGSRVFCGAFAPEDIIRGMGTMTVHFISDDSVNYRGFQSTFQNVNDYNPCRKNNPCKEGTCEFNVKNLTTTCICSPGAQGDHCDEDVQECLSEPCLNGGTCNDDGPINTYECACVPGWTGVNCEAEQGSFCLPNPCEFDGECVENKTAYRCVCKEGYEGSYCENVTGCGNPGIPNLEKQRRFNFGTTLQYSCDGEYDMKGNQNSTCQDDGTWSTVIPKCREKGESDDNTALSSWSLSMIILGGLLSVNVTSFVFYLVYQRPWSFKGPNLEGEFAPSIEDFQQQSSPDRKMSIYSLSASQYSASSASFTA